MSDFSLLATLNIFSRVI